MDLASQLIAILFVFACLALTLWWLKTRGALRFRERIKPRGTNLLEQIDVLQLSPTHSLNLVRIADRSILVGISPSGFYVVESSPWKPFHDEKKASE